MQKYRYLLIYKKTARHAKSLKPKPQAYSVIEEPIKQLPLPEWCNPQSLS